MDLKAWNQIEFKYTTPLTSGQSLVLPLVMENGLAGGIVSGVENRWCMFGVFASHTMTFSCEGSTLGTFATVDTIFTIAVAAGVYTQTHQLAAPQGDTGRVALTRPFVRFRALDTAAANHTATRISVYVFGPAA